MIRNKSKNGVEGYRSPCLYVANVALYHMSYNPFFVDCYLMSCCNAMLCCLEDPTFIHIHLEVDDHLNDQALLQSC
jgi:hypothetical protein